MRSRTKTSSRKVELVSIIDVVFLLLIFFLVTINFMRQTGGNESSDVFEETKVPDTDSQNFTQADLVLVIYPWGSDDASNIEYFLFTPSCNWNLWNTLIAAGSNLNRAILHSSAPAGLNIYVNSSQIKGCIGQRGKIVIKAAETVPWKEVIKIWDMCREVNPAAKISLMISSRAGIFQNIRGIADSITEEIVG